MSFSPVSDNINCYMCIDQNEVLVSDDLQSTSYTLSQGDRVYEKMGKLKWNHYFIIKYRLESSLWLIMLIIKQTQN